MCLPLGPCIGGRSAFKTIYDCKCHCSLEKAAMKYPDSGVAVSEIKHMIDLHIDHTEKWLVDHLYWRDPELGRMYAEEDIRKVVHKYYLDKKAGRI